MAGTRNKNKILTLAAVIIAALLALSLFWFTQLILTRASGNDEAQNDAGTETDAAPAPELIMSHSPGFY